MTDKPWRTGRKVPLNVYEGDTPIAQFQSAEWAAQAVSAHNEVDNLRQTLADAEDHFRQRELLLVSERDEARREAEANREIERLKDIIDKSDSARWLEAVQRACDERMVDLKMELRDAKARADKAEEEAAKTVDAHQLYRRVCGELAQSQRDLWSAKQELSRALHRLHQRLNQIERMKRAGNRLVEIVSRSKPHIRRIQTWERAASLQQKETNHG